MAVECDCGDQFGSITSKQIDTWWTNAQAMDGEEYAQALQGLETWLLLHNGEDLAESIDLAFGEG